MGISTKAIRNRKVIDPSKLPPHAKKQFDSIETELEKAAFFGFGPGSRPNFDTPSFNQTKNETVLHRGNSWIVFGVDRPGNPQSGYGGRLNAHCGMVDIVAGRMGARAVSHYDDGKAVFTNPNFKLDGSPGLS